MPQAFTGRAESLAAFLMTGGIESHLTSALIQAAWFLRQAAQRVITWQFMAGWRAGSQGE